MHYNRMFIVLAESGNHLVESALLDQDTEGENLLNCSEVFTEESTTELLASDPEEMDTEEKETDNVSVAASDSFCSAKSTNDDTANVSAANGDASTGG